MTVRIILLFVATTLFEALPAPVSAQDGQDQLLHYSLLVDLDDEARVQFSAAESELARGDVLTAASRWRALLDSGRTDSLVPHRGALQSISTAVRSLLRGQPQAVRDEYLKITEPLAVRALGPAVQQDQAAALWSIVDRFPLTDAAREACVQLAERSFDAGRFSECRLAVDRWLDELDDPQAGVVRQPQMIVWRTMALLSMGDSAAAEQQWSKYSEFVPPDLRQLVTGLEAMRLLPIATAPRSEPLPDDVQDVTDLLPSEEAVWIHQFEEGVPASDWAATRFDFEELAHPLLMLNRPLATPAGLLLSGVAWQTLDARGRLLWKQPGPLAGSSATRTAAVESLRVELGESVFGRVTVMGDLLLSIEPLQNGVRAAPAFATQLTARSTASGERRWTITEFPGRSGAAPAPATILGPPAERHGQLILALQTDDELFLVALDPVTRSFHWQTRLGDAGMNLMSDTRRRWMPAVVNATGESIVCATGNGAVVSVDPRDGKLRWIHRSQREDWRGAGPPPMSVPVNMPRFRMWTGWREPVVAHTDDLVLWAGPESNALTALDRRTGEVRWTQPRGDALAVVLEKSRILVIAPDHLRRLNPSDGGTQWSAPIAAPAGTGFTVAGWYVLPLRTGGTAAVHLATGAVTRSVAWNAEVEGPARQELDQLRSLTRTRDGVLIESPLSVSLHRTVGDLSRALPAVSSRPQWLAAAGRLSEAEQAIAPSEAKSGQLRSRVRLLAQEIADDQYHIIPSPVARTDKPIESGVRGSINEFLLDRRPETAIALVERTPLPVLSEVWVETNRSPRVRLRADALAAATMIQRPASAVDGRLPAILLPPVLKNRLDRLVERLIAGRSDEIPALLNLLASTDWGGSRLLVALEYPQPGARPVLDAARRRLTLLHLEALGDDLGARAHQLLSTSQSRPSRAWPEGEPRPVAVRPWNSFINQWPMPFELERGTDAAGLSIDFQLQGFNLKKQTMGVHFAGAGQGRPWSIDLPKSNRSLAQSADYRRAHAVGPLVVLQVGTGLYGILPFDEAGQRGATHAWDVPWIDLWGNVASHSVSFLPRLSDVAPGRHPLDLDDFARPLTQVGPVTASYFCYREFDRLVTCETATGRRLWDRRPLNPDAFVVGDERQVIVVSPGLNQVDILDPLDGRQLFNRPFDFSSHQWRAAIKSTATVRSGGAEKPGEPSGLAAVDLASGQVRWKQLLAQSAADFMVGRRLVGGVDSEAIRLFDPESGEPRATIPITAPREIADVYAVDDPYALMICVFGPPAVEQLRPPLMLVGSRRRPYANGTVYGLDPQSLELKWTLPLDRSVFPLDQPTDIPLLVINDAVIFIDENGQELRNDRIRCFDKRTGRQVGQDLLGQFIGGYGFVIDRDLSAGWIQVRTSKGIFRFDFNADPQLP